MRVRIRYAYPGGAPIAHIFDRDDGMGGSKEEVDLTGQGWVSD